MPKMKTKKSFSKRFHATANGKLKYKKQGLRHILTKKIHKTQTQSQTRRRFEHRRNA